jgi:DNA-binding LacI/PurR family transcriptional regulator
MTQGGPSVPVISSDDLDNTDRGGSMTEEQGTRRATSADVARASGVSRATVSYVLNNSPDRRISEATKNLVLETATRLGHIPNPLARALKTGRSNVVVCLVPALTLGFVFDHALDRLTRALADRGYALLINRVTGFRSTSDAADLWGHVAPSLVMTIGGIMPPAIADLLKDAPAPVLNDEGIVPHVRIGRMQAEHLMAAGHRRIGYAMPEDAVVRVYAEPRLRGVADACAAAGIPAPDVRIVGDALSDHALAVREWMADGVTGAMHGEHVSAPRDLAVIGSDDVPLAAAGLTTVALDIEVCAALFIHDVLSALGETSAPRPDRDILQLIERASA